MLQDSGENSNLIGHYDLKEKLAEGGFGVVYIAKDTRLNRDVAVKVLHSYHASEPTRIARFIREAQSAAKLNHPGIVQIYDIVESGERMALVMEFVRGANLDRYLKDHPELSLRDKVEIGAQIAETLHAAHQSGIIHRDVKPANVMMDEYGRVKLTDFSLARLVDNSLTPLTGENNVLGTPAYMSPEQCLGYEATPQSDIYSLGVVLYEMATGAPLFEAENYLALMRHHTDTPPTPVRLIKPNLPAALERLIMNCLAKAPEKRPASANEVLQTLRALELPASDSPADPSISKTIALSLDELDRASLSMPNPVPAGGELGTDQPPEYSPAPASVPQTPGAQSPISSHDAPIVHNISSHSFPPGITAPSTSDVMGAQAAQVGMTPQPMQPGMTPQPMQPGMTPQSMYPGMTPQPMQPGMTPQPMQPGMTPQPMQGISEKRRFTRLMLPVALGAVILVLMGIVAGLIMRRPVVPEVLSPPPATSETPAGLGPAKTIVGTGALAEYVREVDDNFSYKLHTKIDGEGYEAFILDMVSQTWHADKTVPPVWRHWVTIVKPEKVTTDTALVVFSNGFSTPDKPLEEVPVLLLALALTTKSVVAIVEGFPRDRVGFQDDIDHPEEVDRNEFAVMSFMRYLDSGDLTWPIVCPMVKSVVRSMDCVQAYLAQELSPPLPVEEFVLTGEANGWGIWLSSAIDNRVAGIAPIQFDLLNISGQIKHQVGGRTEMSPFLSLFSDLDVMPALDTEAGKELLALIDPMLYRNQLNVPKLLLLPGHNDYTTVDAVNLYYDELEGETSLFCAPNITLTRNNPFLPQRGRQAVLPASPDRTEYSALDFRDTLQVFYHRVLVGKAMPRFSWRFEEDGAYEIVTEEAPTEVLLWLAQVDTRDTLYENDMTAPWKMERLNETGLGAYQGRVILEDSLLTVFYIEMVYPSMLGLNFSLTTPTQILAAQEKPATLTQPSMGYPTNAYPSSAHPSLTPRSGGAYAAPTPSEPYSSPAYPGYAPIPSQKQPTSNGAYTSSQAPASNTSTTGAYGATSSYASPNSSGYAPAPNAPATNSGYAPVHNPPAYQQQQNYSAYPAASGASPGYSPPQPATQYQSEAYGYRQPAATSSPTTASKPQLPDSSEGD